MGLNKVRTIVQNDAMNNAYSETKEDIMDVAHNHDEREPRNQTKGENEIFVNRF